MNAATTTEGDELGEVVAMRRVAVDEVRIADRHRRDLGDIAGLAASIASIGLIHPIAVTEDYLLVAGERRLAAIRSLGWAEVPVIVITGLNEASDVLTAERDENTCRKEMTVSELMSLAVALEELERPRAAARKAQGGAAGRAARYGQDLASDQMDGSQQGEAREIVAKAIGMSAGTYNRARAVYRAATDPATPDEEQQVAHEALADVDAGVTTIAGAYNRVREQREKQTPRRNTINRAADQRRAIAASETTLSGIAMGLSQITELHPDITCDEAVHWLDGLVKSRRAIDGLIKQLKERTNAEV